MTSRFVEDAVDSQLMIDQAIEEVEKASRPKVGVELAFDYLADEAVQFDPVFGVTPRFVQKGKTNMPVPKKHKLTEMDLDEISLVDHGANQFASIVMFKRRDPLSAELKEDEKKKKPGEKLVPAWDSTKDMAEKRLEKLSNRVSSLLEKFNPYHDAQGQFASAGGGGGYGATFKPSDYGPPLSSYRTGLKTSPKEFKPEDYGPPLSSYRTGLKTSPKETSLKEGVSVRATGPVSGKGKRGVSEQDSKKLPGV